MNEDLKIVLELQNMLKESLVPLSVQKDIHERCSKIKRGNVTLSEIKGSDPFMEEVFEMARKRVENNKK
ncbi:hypothetical protein [Virgibacillus sediminis]|uniref:Uncharacterized protein n=1 Tax=Virgibacillus sediminis TaxID=202260 RepID=A0ABV7A1S8_9BACI